MVHIEREWAMPSRWTFEVEPIRELLDDEMGNGIWIDPFAGKNSPADITNDLNDERNTDYNMRAREFLEMFDDGEIDGGILLDPPYSNSAIKRCYEEIGEEPREEDFDMKFYSRPREETTRILQKEAKAISFGWNTIGIGKNRGFTKKRILMVCHGGARNDTLVTVSVKSDEVSYTPFQVNHNSAGDAQW